MAKRSLSIIAAVVILGVMAVPVLAQVPAPGGPFTSTVVVQNMSGTEANCSLSFYSSNGSLAASSGNYNIQSFDSQFVYTSSIGGLAQGSYSSVVSCDQQVLAISLHSDSDSEASYRGVGTPASTYYAPGIYDDYYGYYSNIVVQNTTSNVIDVTVQFYAEGNPVVVLSQTAQNVAAYASTEFVQAGQANLAENVPHSAVISAVLDGTATPANIAVVVDVYGSADGVPSGVADSTPQLLSYNAFSAGATTWYTPVNMVSYYGWNSALVIQNIGTSTTNVTVEYSNGESQAQNVAAKSAWSIYLPVQSPLNNNPGILAGAKITSASENIVVMTNESNNYQRAATYTGLTGGSGQLFAPLMGKNSGPYRSSLTCQNLGLSATTATATFQGAGAGGVDVAVASPAIASQDSYVWYLPNIANITNGWTGGVVITSGGTVGCIANWGDDVGTAQEDILSSYEAQAAP